MDGSTPLRVHSLRIIGNDRTNSSLIENALAPALQGENLQSISQSINDGLNCLESYGIFESAKITMDKGPTIIDQSIDPSIDPLTHQSINRPILTTNLLVDVKERKSWGAKTEVAQELHTGEQVVKMSALLRNVFGSGEKFEMSSSRGAQQSASFQAMFTMPQPFKRSPLSNHQPADQSIDQFGRKTSEKPIYQSINRSMKQSFLSNCRAALGLNMTTHNYSRQASFCESVRGVTAALLNEQTINQSTGQSLNHELVYEYALRDIIPVSKVLTDDEKRAGTYQGPSSFVRAAAAQPSIKSSLKYQVTNSSLDDRFVPTSGRYVSSSFELAGLGGDVSFGKVNVEAKQYFPIHPAVTFGLSCNLGGVRALTKSTNKSVHLSDRFFLGHSMHVRGFSPFTLGPLDHEDNIGGDVLATCAASLSFLLPIASFRDIGARLHLFANSGNLIELNTNQSAKQTIKQAASEARVSVGMGLAVPSPLGRLEFNLVHAAQKQSTDRTRSLQWGLGWQYA